MTCLLSYKDASILLLISHDVLGQSRVDSPRTSTSNHLAISIAKAISIADDRKVVKRTGGLLGNFGKM
jgi:hypothetical protein